MKWVHKGFFTDRSNHCHNGFLIFLSLSLPLFGDQHFLSLFLSYMAHPHLRFFVYSISPISLSLSLSLSLSPLSFTRCFSMHLEIFHLLLLSSFFKESPLGGPFVLSSLPVLVTLKFRTDEKRRLVCQNN